MVDEMRPKYGWVMSHTCRRSFCANEFLDGTPVTLIMAISGHKTEKAFRKYIKADNLQKAQMIKKIWEGRRLYSFRILFYILEYYSIFKNIYFNFVILCSMVIISKAILKEFAQKHPDAEIGLEKWYNDTKSASWKNFAEAKKTFNTVDGVGNDRYVFDIKGNQYRLIALIIFKVRTVFILFVGTHKEYDKVNANKVIYKK
jgi:mRNA interferase HigB